MSILSAIDPAIASPARAVQATPTPVVADEATAVGRARRDTRLIENQALRWQRFKLAALTTFLVVAVVGCLVLFGRIAADAFFHALAAIIIAHVLFGWALRSGLNLRFRDPSLTLPMMVCGTAVLLYVMARTQSGHELVSMLYLFPFVFGTLRLRTRALVIFALIVLAIDAAFVAMNPSRFADGAWQLEALRWLVLAAVLVWFAFMGGFLSSLRERLNAVNAQLRHNVRTIEHLVSHDELTGVFNRRELVAAISAESARSARYAAPWAVCLFDIDFFKRVNDTYGHAVGDTVLREFARALDHAKRPTDVFGRYGGEEFMLIFSQTRIEQAVHAADRMRRMVESLTIPGLDAAFRVTTSAGVAEHQAGEDWQTTVHRADEALYRAKQSGRNRVESTSSESM
jgi:diguanylate cyclase